MHVQQGTPVPRGILRDIPKELYSRTVLPQDSGCVLRTGPGVNVVRDA